MTKMKTQIDQTPEYSACRNCGHTWTDGDKYCPKCAQKRSANLTVKGLIHEFIHTTLHLDGKLFKMLHYLFVPGKITKDFIEGKQKRYPHPIQFFVVVAALFILSFWKLIAPIITKDINFNLFSSVSSFKDINPSVLGPTMSYVARTEDFFSDSTGRRSFVSQGMYDSLLHEVFDVRIDTAWSSFKKQGKFDLGVLTVNADTMDFKDLFLKEPSVLAQKGSTEDKSWFGKLLPAQMIRVLQNPNAFTKSFIGNFALTLTAMLLIQALILKLLYFRKKRHYPEHVLFLLNISTTMLLSMIAMFLITKYLPQSYWNTIWFIWGMVFLIFQYFSLKVVYGQSYLRTFFKFLIYAFSYFIVGVFVFTSSVILSILILGN
jgi:hypothetical protein